MTKWFIETPLSAQNDLKMLLSPFDIDTRNFSFTSRREGAFAGSVEEMFAAVSEADSLWTET